MARLREQHRAAAALKAVERFKGSKKAADIRQELQQLPARILGSGLGQTLAFYASKRDVHDDIGSELASFLSGDEKARTTDFLRQLMDQGDVVTYRQRTREALAYAEWLKRYAKALLAE